MKYIQKDCKVNVAIVGERNDEDHAVASVMKLTELTDEEVDGMILEIDVDDTQCSEQIVDVLVPQIAERIVGNVTAFHERIPRTSHRTDRQHVDTHTKWWGTSSKILCHTKWWRRSSKILSHTKWWRRSSKILPPTAVCERTGCEDCLQARPSSAPVNKS